MVGDSKLKNSDATVHGRMLMDGILDKRHRRLLEIKFKPKLDHIKVPQKQQLN